MPCGLPVGQVPDVSRPQISFFLFKYVSMIMTGFLAATFVISGHGFETWRAIYCRLVGLKSDEAASGVAVNQKEIELTRFNLR